MHEFGIRNPISACCYQNVGTHSETKSIRIDGDLVEIEEALEVFDGGNLNDLEWGQHQTVTVIPESDPPEYQLVDSVITASRGYQFENNSPSQGLPYGRGKAQTRHIITLSAPWREQDGAGLEITQGSIGRNYEWDEIGGVYNETSTSKSESTAVVPLGVGDTSGVCSVQTFTALGVEGLIFERFAPSAPVPFGVSSDNGGTYSQGVLAQAPAASLMGQRMGMCNFYAERRGTGVRDLTLSFASQVGGLYPMSIQYTKTTRNAQGEEVSSSSDSVFLDSADTVTKVIAAPASEGRIYAHSFITSTVEYFFNPVVRGTVQCIESD